MTALLIVALGVCTVGLLTRVAAPLVALLGTHVFAVMNGYGYANFHIIPLVLISWPLALAPSGDALSLDALLGRGRKAMNPVDYHWPIRLAQITLPALMFTGGLQKIINAWFAHPVANMRSFLLYKYYPQAAEKGWTLPDLLLSVAEHEWILLPMALAMLICEFGSPLALPDGRPLVRVLLIGGLFLMQLNLALVLKTLPSFPWLAVYVFWVPWEAVWNRLSPGRPGGSVESVAA